MVGSYRGGGARLMLSRMLCDSARTAGAVSGLVAKATWMVSGCQRGTTRRVPGKGLCAALPPKHVGNMLPQAPGTPDLGWHTTRPGGPALETAGKRTLKRHDQR